MCWLCGESHLEQAGLGKGEVDVRSADLAESTARPQCRLARLHPGESLLHRLLELVHGHRGHLGKQLFAVYEVSVCRIVRYTRLPGHLAQHDPIRPVAPSEVDSGHNESWPEVAVVIGAHEFIVARC